MTAFKLLMHSQIGRFFLYVIPLDFLVRSFQRMTWLFARLLLLRDWHHGIHGRPQFFKHAVNFACWPFESERWAFTARGVFARAYMNRGCRVLDLCCGDGSNSSMFFSDIASIVDAVDQDIYAISYARKNYADKNVNYHRLDIINQAFPNSEYDVVVWNAAICYFSTPEIQLVIEKIRKVSAAGSLFIGMCPKSNGWVDHKTEFVDAASLKSYLLQFYAQVSVLEVDEIATTSFYFKASEPLVIPRII